MKRWPWLLPLALLVACSARQASPPPLELNLLPPREMGAPVLRKEKVTMQAGQVEQQFLAVARFEPRRLRLAVLAPSGQSLLSIDYDGIRFVQESSVGVEIPGREILALMQFARWPPDSLRRHYPEQDGWRIEVSDGERRLLTESGIALNIAYQPRILHIDNYFKEYRVIVETLEKTDL